MMWKAARRDYDGPEGLQLSLASMSAPSSLLLLAVLGNVRNAGTEEEHSLFFNTQRQENYETHRFFLSQRRRDGQYRQKQRS